MPKRILVADDNANIRRVIKMEFESLGYEVETVGGGVDALASVRRNPPDLVILDVMMPDKNGHDVCYEIKKDPALQSVPVLLLTAKAMEEDRYWGREIGADEYVTKPFDPEELEKVVERIFQMRDRGENYHPLTKLPMWAAVRHEIERRRLQGEKFTVVSCRLEPRAFDVYQKKYGNIKADNVVLQASQLISSAVEHAAGGKGFLGQAGDNVFFVVAPAGAAAGVRERADGELAAMVPFQYDEGDAEQGYVLSRTLSGEEERVPLMTLQWEEPEVPAE